MPDVVLPLVRCVQFERTLIVAEDDSQVSYLEGCTAPSYDSNQVPFFPCHAHAALGCSCACSPLQSLVWGDVYIAPM